MKTLFTGQNKVTLSIVNSTNNYAAKMLNQTKVPEGTAILADEQHSGKGQGTNKWESKPGENLTLSVVYFPKFLSADQQFRLSEAVSLSLIELLQHYGLTGMIKWPNDIYVEGQKISGMLIENLIRGHQLSHSIIGVGLNVNQQDFSGLNATSIRSLTSSNADLDEVFELFCTQLESHYLELKSGSSGISERYRSRLIGYREVQDYLLYGSEVEGVLEEVLPDGRIQVSINGENKLYDHSRIRMRF